MSNLSGFRAKRFLAHPAALGCAGILVGAVAWSGYAVLLPVSLVFLALLPIAHNSLGRWCLAIGYYCAASWTVLPGAAIFYGHDYRPISIGLLWLGVSILLAAPWALLCRSAWIAWAVPLCLVLEAVPPLAAFGIANPLVSAGMIFPHTSWLGFILFFILVGFITARPLPTIAVVIVTVIATTFVKPAAPPPGWVAVNTQLGGQGIDTPDQMRDFAAAQYIQRTALKTQATVVVFPESVANRWSQASEAFWGRTLTQLRREKKTMIVGATIPLAGQNSGYRNTAVIRGADSAIYDERIPMPVSMWKPLDNGGVPMNYLGPSTVDIAGQHAAVLICYEQLLVWPVIRSAADRPTVLIGMANDYWAAKTYFPRIQAASMASWGRLFDLPIISAVNR